MVGDPLGLETDLTLGKSLRPQCYSKKSQPGRLGVPEQSSHVRRVVPAPGWPGRSVGEA